jgi:hypothetical protein
MAWNMGSSNVNSSSNIIDVGNRRIMWGIVNFSSSGSQQSKTATFPASFKDNSWTLTFGFQGTAIPAGSPFFDVKNAGDFRVWIPAVSASTTLHYMAIGPKP